MKGIIRTLLIRSLFVFAGVGLLVGCSSSKEAARSSGGEDDREVSVGYGTQKRSQVTGAISTIELTEEEKQTAVSLRELLVGRAAGVQVMEGAGGSLVVRIRGTSSIMGSNEPLYIVDGMPVSSGPGGTITGINPSDVESIEVLKDAAATAIYGSRGGNGVIIINMKRGGR